MRRVLSPFVPLAAMAAIAFVPALAVGQNTLVSRNSNGDQEESPTYDIAVSDDATKIVLASPASNLGEGNDQNNLSDIFFRDLTTGRTVRVSQRPNGGDANGESVTPVISGDGSVIAYQTYATNLFLHDDNNALDVLVYDTATGKNSVGNVATDGTLANDTSGAPFLSYDGSVLVFASRASNLVAGDSNGNWDVFLRDRKAGTTTRLSVAADGSEVLGDSFSGNLSDDGTLLGFQSNGDFVPGMSSGYQDIYVKDLVTGAVEIDNIAVDGSPPWGGGSFDAQLSGDGSVVAFVSEAYNLFPGDVPYTREVYVHDRTRNQTELASVSMTGGLPNAACEEAHISRDGRFVYFTSNATNLVAGTGKDPQVFVRDRLLGVTMLAVYNKEQELPAGGTTAADVTPDGRILALVSGANDLTDDDHKLFEDGFLRDCGLQASAWSNYGAGWPGTNGVPTLVADVPPAFGTTVTLDASNSFGSWSVGVLFVGDSSADLPTGFGGHLLLIPYFVDALVLPPAGATFSGTIPADERLAGVSAFAQLFEQDPGASDGVSFTPGLQLSIGF